MTISSNLLFFNNKPVKDFDPTTGLDDTSFAYRFRIEYDDRETVVGLLEKMLADPKAATLEEIVIGIWDYEGGSSLSVRDWLITNAHQLPQLKAIMFGDITYEENEISWIEQTDMSPLLEAYPQLETFQVRGGMGLRFNQLAHEQLRKLTVETGGLAPSTIEDVIQAKLPNLEHLELWLGSGYYGFESDVEDLAPLLRKSTFPKLTYLGLRDSEIVDEIALHLQDADILDIIEVLDLSKGALSNKGAQALYDNPKIQQLQYLDLHYHYLSEACMLKLDSLDLKVNLDEAQGEAAEDDRYIAVSE